MIPTASSRNAEEATEESPRTQVSNHERTPTADGLSGAANANHQIPEPSTNAHDESTTTSTTLAATLPVTESRANPGYIKVLSRTLVVDGISSQPQLRSLFMNFDRVQISTNFGNSRVVVKMGSHQDAIKAREGTALFGLYGVRSIQWGLGFSAHRYMDFSTGISTIPIGHLFEMERGMLLTANHGGSGGLPIQSGMVVEEPDTGPHALISLPSFGPRVVILTDLDMRRSSDNSGVRIRGQYPARDFAGFFTRVSRSSR